MTETIFNYIMKNFEALYKIEHGKFNINYGIDGISKIQIKQGNINYFSVKETLDPGCAIWKDWNGEGIPFFFDSESSSSVITESGSHLIINYDIIASSFYFLSNWQEYVCSEADIYGRFIMTESIQYKLNFITKPVVNYYFDILKTAIERAYHIELIQTLWQGKKIAVCLTHDIDLCQSAWLQGSFRELLKGNIFTPFKLVASRLFSDDLWFNFQEIIEIEKRFDANSTFFFLPFKGRKNGIPNADYNIAKSKFKKVFSQIEKIGSEVAIHGSIGTSSDSDLLKSEISIIESDVTGNRFHFLMYDSSICPEVLSESALKYDSTLGFAEIIGFRNSYCLPFYLFDIKNKRSTNVLEIPLAVMDVSFSEKYMAVTKDEALDKVLTIVKEVEKFSGCFTLLWHNTYFSEYKYTGWKEVYCKILEHCSGIDSLMTSGRNICNLFVSKR
jgi:hypothetical protein